jgi:general secretion pathway protein F
MPDYDYTAITRDGLEVKGNLTAENESDLQRQLKKRQLGLLHAKAKKIRGISFQLAAMLVTELAQLLNSGVPLERSLQIIHEDSHNPALADLADRLRKSIKRGDAFSVALGQLGQQDPILTALVRVGEASGELGKILGILDSYYNEAQQTRREVLAALAYPAILAIVSILSIIGLALFVIPVFQDLFQDSPASSIPLGTRIVFAFSGLLLDYGLLILALLIGTGVSIGVTLKRSTELRRQWHRIKLRLPLIGPLLAGYDASRFAKALGIMLQSGLPLAQAMEMVRPLFTNLLQQTGTDDAVTALRKGISVPAALDRIPGLPSQIHRFAKLGNETGRLPESMQRAAELIHDQVRIRLRSLVAILDPLIIVVMGGAVGFMVISVLMAVFSLSDIR